MSEFVPSGDLYDIFLMVGATSAGGSYTACPKCFTSMTSKLASTGRPGIEPLQVQCSSCSTRSCLDELQLKYRLKLQLVYGSTIADAILFDEVAESLLGVSAAKMKKEILVMYPTMPQLLEELLLGLRVSFSFQRPVPRRNAKEVQFVRDLKITQIKPLIPQLLPEPAVLFAVKLLQDN